MITAAVADSQNDLLRAELVYAIRQFFSEERCQFYPDDEIVLAGVVVRMGKCPDHASDAACEEYDSICYLTSETVTWSNSSFRSDEQECYYQDLFTIELIYILDALERNAGQWNEKKMDIIDETH